MKLEGSKVYLRPIEVTDTDSMVKWRNREFVRKNFINQEPLTPEIHLNWLKTKVDTGKVVQFIITVNDTGRAIGSVYLRDIDKDEKKAEYGILIGEEDALGHGYGTEACRLMIDYAKDVLKLDRIFLRLRKSNEIAHKSYLKAGFKDREQAESANSEIIFMDCIFK